jgi:hypothetical protein
MPSVSKNVSPNKVSSVRRSFCSFVRSFVRPAHPIAPKSIVARTLPATMSRVGGIEGNFLEKQGSGSEEINQAKRRISDPWRDKGRMAGSLSCPADCQRRMAPREHGLCHLERRRRRLRLGGATSSYTQAPCIQLSTGFSYAELCS